MTTETDIELHRLSFKMEKKNLDSNILGVLEKEELIY